MMPCPPRWCRPAAAAVAAVAVALIGSLAACGATVSAVPPAPSVGSAGTPEIDVAIGASETVGAGIDDSPLRLRDAWPQLFYNAALPRAATLVNLGIPGATTAAAIARELPAALRLRPTVVTVWLNVDDLVAGVPAATYEAQLDQLVRALRQGGRATVLVANTPELSHLPAYLACRSGRPCILGAAGADLPDAAAVEGAVGAYNAATARVVARDGAVLVDLHAEGDVPVDHPDWVGSDGFHPSFLGHAEVARLFAAAYAAARR